MSVVAKKTIDQTVPLAIPGFEMINRYWDRARDMPLAKILPGEYYVTLQDELITTVLGSCVSVCVRDRVFEIGGMNHFMLPQCGKARVSSVSLGDAARYGNYAMEHLINKLLSNGAKRNNLEVKVVGGGKVIEGMMNVGMKNIEFILDYLRVEGLEIVSQDLGGEFPRKVVYHPRTGRLLVRKMKNVETQDVISREENYRNKITREPVSGEIVLFD